MVALLVASACTGDGGRAASPSPAVPTVASSEVALVGDAGCQPPTPVTTSPTGMAEARGTGNDVAAWALLWEVPPWRTGQEVKVVWRMPGTGEFRVVARDERGEIVDPLRGPTPHLDSNWDRPGDEWGTFFALPSPGCWTLEASRDDVVSRVFVVVEA